MKIDTDHLHLIKNELLLVQKLGRYSKVDAFKSKFLENQIKNIENPIFRERFK